ncbi:MAG TPA: hypothetical protein VMD02_02615 [Candidatus Omnitrophota bacterium]|nr:hypothetical protein [Candidatus Omnitrophota bacterium]
MIDPINRSGPTGTMTLSGQASVAKTRIVRFNFNYAALVDMIYSPQSRPADIKTIAVVDDRVNMVRVIGFRMANRLGELAGCEVKCTRLEDLQFNPQILQDHHVVTASTPEVIRSMPGFLIDRRPDLAFIDHDMFDLNGPALIRQARVGGYKGIVIGMTEKEANIRSLREAGADMVIDKVSADVVKFLKEGDLP